MSNVACRLFTAAAAVVALTACGGSDKGASGARELFDQSKEAFAAGNYELAKVLLDSIDHAYPAEVDVRREGMAFMPDVMERLAMERLSQADSAEVTLQARMEALSQGMTKVDNYVEPYWAASEGRDPNLVTKGDGIEARMSLEGEFYIISALNSAPIRHHSITLAIDGESASTPQVERDGEVNYADAKGEVVTYSYSQSKPLGELASRHRGSGGTVTFHGAKGDKTLRLSGTQVDGIARAYELSLCALDLRAAQADKAKYNRHLTVARDQKARLAIDGAKP